MRGKETSHPSPAPPALAGYLEASAAQYPDRTAIVDPDGSAITYRELNAQADRVAGFLVARGVARGDRVALVLPKCIHTVATIFGILKAGAAYVPTDWTAPAARNRAIIDDCAVRVAFVDHRRRDVLETAAASALPATVVLAGCTPAEAAASGIAGTVSDAAVRVHAPLPSRGASRAQDLAYILYTSGSTGVPKGVMLTHANATSFVEWCSATFAPQAGDRFSSHAPFHFDLSVFDLYVAIKHGATVFLVSEELSKDARGLAHFIADKHLTVWYSTPSVLMMLTEFGQLDRLDCRALRLVFFAGEVFPVEPLRRLVGLWPQATYFNLYGPTETNVCTFARIPVPVPAARTEPYPIGQPCAHCSALVLDQALAPVRPGEEGLLYIAGASVFQGYWNRPALNDTAFIECADRRWYNTGDIVRETPDGFVYVGRRDRMVKRRGYRIELGEIESVLYQHPAIREAAVTAAADPQVGVRVIAHLAARGASRPSIIELKQFCGQRLPAYMNPDVFRFHAQLPRTATDKVDYQLLVGA